MKPFFSSSSSVHLKAISFNRRTSALVVCYETQQLFPRSSRKPLISHLRVVNGIGLPVIRSMCFLVPA